MRVCSLNKHEISLLHAVKVFNEGITFLKYSPDGHKLVAVSSTGRLFFFEIDYDENGKVSPFALIELGE
jgi:hypothetical protein